MFFSRGISRKLKIIINHDIAQISSNYFYKRNDQTCRYFATNTKSRLVLGIESSCDDTGAAVVDEEGNILGEGFYSQLPLVLKLGGILGPLTGRVHASHIQKVVKDALNEAKIDPSELSAIAASNRPGYIQSLKVGCGYGQRMSLHYKIPFIPIHHMQAHALTVRMIHKVEFPYLVLLVSGGHALLVLAQSLENWKIIGDSLDIAPGNVFDKVARRLKLKNNPLTASMSGGRAIEKMAENGKIIDQLYPEPLSQKINCDFSFSGIIGKSLSYIEESEKEYGIEGGDMLPNAADICVTLQSAITKHICKRTQRALVFCSQENLLPEHNQTLVVSGGVASNTYLRSRLKILCEALDYKLFCPPPKLCTDNGIMIAWNGMERLKANLGILHEPQKIKEVTVSHREPIGDSLQQQVSDARISLRRQWIIKN